MRISDWSSDVCSSDLGWRVAGLEGAIDLLHVIGNALRLPQQLLGPSDRLLEFLQRGVGQARQIAGLIDEALRLVLQRGDLVGDLLERARSRRSEEHTSELQSLMRSSYAVSCLKKKKRGR